jgi:XapX domain-containing protein
MKIYLVSLGTGVLVGLIYNLLQVRSPAPPFIALVGLLGMLMGEQAIPVGKLLIHGPESLHIWTGSRQAEHTPRDGELGRDDQPLRPAK